MNPIMQYILVEVRELATPRKPQPKIEILRGLEATTVSPAALQGSASQHDCWMAERCAILQVCSAGLRMHWKPSSLHYGSAPVNDLGLAADCYDGWIAVQIAGLGG